MVYFMVLKRRPSPVFVGTEESLPRVLDGYNEKLAKVQLVPLDPDHPRLTRTKASYLRRRAGRLGDIFATPRQMEGGADEYREFAKRFGDLMILDHVFHASEELVAYIAEHTVPWTGDHATRLGMPQPVGRGPLHPDPKAMADHLARRR
jgi:hypothetical protein